LAEADKKRKKLLTNGLGFANIIFALERAADVSKKIKNKFKKLLTNERQPVIINNRCSKQV